MICGSNGSSQVTGEFDLSITSVLYLGDDIKNAYLCCGQYEATGTGSLRYYNGFLQAETGWAKFGFTYAN